MGEYEKFKDYVERIDMHEIYGSNYVKFKNKDIAVEFKKVLEECDRCSIRDIRIDDKDDTKINFRNGLCDMVDERQFSILLDKPIKIEKYIKIVLTKKPKTVEESSRYIKAIIEINGDDY